MKRTIVATFEEDGVQYARIKDSYWYADYYYTAFNKPIFPSYWYRMDTGNEVLKLDRLVQGFKLAKTLGDKIESKTVRKILR